MTDVREVTMYVGKENAKIKKVNQGNVEASGIQDIMAVPLGDGIEEKREQDQHTLEVTDTQDISRVSSKP